MFIKTPKGKRCPFPDGIVVTENPLDVPNSVFLRRRLKDGSVMLTTKTQSPEPVLIEKDITEKNSLKTRKKNAIGET